MSIFASLVTKVLEVPGDAGQTITIRKLAPKHLMAARRQSQKDSLDQMRDMGDPAFIRQVQELASEGAGSTASTAVKADPLLLYDRVILMQHGIVSWSYDREPTREVLEDIDEDTSDWLAREILRLTKPTLFQSEAEREEATKND